MRTLTRLFRGPDRGVTLIELMIALLAGGLILTALTRFYVSQHYVVTEQMSVAELQQGLRASMQEISEQIRMIGYGMPPGMDPLVASNGNPDTIQFYYQLSPTSRVELQEDMADPNAELRCSGLDVTEFTSHHWCYIWDNAANTGEFVYLSAVDYGTGYLYHSLQPLSRAYPAGSEVIALEIYRYYVDRTDSLNPVLMRSRQGEGAAVFSEKIQDLQLRYLQTNGVWADVPIAGRLVRAVEITLVARDDHADHTIVQDRRERTLTTRVEVRNLAL